MTLYRFGCAHTLREFCGQVNRRKFGVPRGGVMSSGLAILCCAMVELEIGLGPEGLVGTVVRFMDDAFGIYAARTVHMSSWSRSTMVK